FLTQSWVRRVTAQWSWATTIFSDSLESGPLPLRHGSPKGKPAFQSGDSTTRLPKMFSRKKHGPLQLIRPNFSPCPADQPARPAAPRWRVLNGRLLLLLLVLTVLFGVGVHFLHAFQVKRNAGALLAQANQAEQDGDLEQMTRYLGHFLAFEPTDA